MAAIERDQVEREIDRLEPHPFTLDDPPSKLSRLDDDLEVTWAPADSGDPMRLDFDGDCIFPYGPAASDTGSYIVGKGKLDSSTMVDTDKDGKDDSGVTCDITADVERSREGTADSQFDPESWFKLHQRRSASFTSNP